MRAHLPAGRESSSFCWRSEDDEDQDFSSGSRERRNNAAEFGETLRREFTRLERDEKRGSRLRHIYGARGGLSLDSYHAGRSAVGENAPEGPGRAQNRPLYADRGTARNRRFTLPEDEFLARIALRCDGASACVWIL